MTINVLVGFINLLCIGILAGEEFTIRYGVRGPLASLAPQPHIEFRQALIRHLRIVVPTIFMLSILSGVAAAIAAALANGIDVRFGLRCAGVAALIAFITITLSGTVPINQMALGWNAAAPPAEWKAMVNRWERLDTLRCWAAMLAFVLFLLALLPR